MKDDTAGTKAHVSSNSPDHVKALLDALWSNWAFRLSLSSNELFHSNALQYFAELASDFRPGLAPGEVTYAAAISIVELLCGSRQRANELVGTNVTGARFFVSREWADIDLVLRQGSGKSARPLAGLEVKVKDFPTAAQLRREVDSLQGAPLFLLSGADSSMLRHLLDSKENKDWSSRVSALDFQELSDRLHIDNPDGLRIEYRKLCAALHGLFTALHRNLRPELTLCEARRLADQLEPYRLHSLWWKLWAAFVAKTCREKVGVRGDHLKIEGDFAARSKTGTLSAYWHAERLARDASLRVGVQVEGNSFRLFLSLESREFKDRVDARRLSERLLLDLCALHGLFRCNPAMAIYQQRWAAGGVTRRRTRHPYTNPWSFSRPLTPVRASVFSDVYAGKGNLDMGDPDDTGVSLAKYVPRLPGFANSPQQGFVDFRSRLVESATVKDIADLVEGALLDDRYCALTGSAQGLVQRIAQRFASAPDVSRWIAHPDV